MGPDRARRQALNAIIRFPSRGMALALHNDAAYQPAKQLRQESTSNCMMVLVDRVTHLQGEHSISRTVFVSSARTSATRGSTASGET